MKGFNVIWWDHNKSEPEPYDIIPYLVYCYNKAKKNDRPKTFEEFKVFIEKESMYRWWSRCEYEIIIKEWPSRDKESKWDIHQQVMMNIDVITEIIMNSIK